MNNFLISLNHLKYNFQNSISNILMMVISFMLVTIIFISTHQINNKLKNDSKNIDGVIGAKGSALQIALSTIWHVDIPTGNIKYNNFDKFKYHPAIKKAVPIALGDNFKGFRIISSFTLSVPDSIATSM